MPKRTCSADGCGDPHWSRGLCRRHYKVTHEYCTVVCVECATEFRSSRATGKLCSDECRSKYYTGNLETGRRRTPRPLVHVPDAPAFTWLPAQHPVMRLARQPRPRVWFAGPCSWCETPFVFNQPAARFCSTRCSARHHEAKSGRRFIISPRRRLAIYERDGWTCQLCMEPVDRDLMSTDPINDWAPSLDHIECQSWALVPDHSDANLRLAHRWCNAVRGDGRYYTEADLITA